MVETRLDIIRKMTDEQMAAWLSQMGWKEYDECLAWLRTPIVEDGVLLKKA